MSRKDLLQELKLLIRSRYGLIWVKTLEEDRAASLLKILSDWVKLSLFIWSVDQGLRREINRGIQRGDAEQAIEDTKDPEQALDYIDRHHLSGMY
ncbi:hypothetical protein GF339_14720, partial [candidate division KSB3 bacterium]|nr:hypothetical protein [candidate division KSB3 bacterium]MBD3325836.1 hypothetical protein [candidate division KSB3 bacterium]